MSRHNAKSQATNYCMMCMAMGPPWVKWSSSFKCLRFLYVVEGLEETFHREWAIHEKWTKDMLKDLGM